jgi:hypothetical protein
MLMERNAEVLRGWPYDGSLDMVEPIASGSTFSNGDWVAPGSGGVTQAAPTGAGVATAGLVIQGNGDSGSSAYSGKAVVLWGNFIARIKNFTAGSYSAGTPVTVKVGKITVGVPGTDAIIGFVTKVGTANAGMVTGNTDAPNDAYIVIRVQ